MSDIVESLQTIDIKGYILNVTIEWEKGYLVEKSYYTLEKYHCKLLNINSIFNVYY